MRFGFPFHRYLPLLFMVLLVGEAGGQGWERTYGGMDYDDARAVRQTIDGGYIIAAYTTSFGVGGDIYLIKTNTNGDTLWTKVLGGINADYARSIRQTFDGGYIIVGGTNSFGSGFYDVYLIKTDANGNPLWMKTYGGTGAEVGNSVQQTSDGGYFVAGNTQSYGAGNNDVYLIKTDGNGDTLWTKTFGDSLNDYCYSAQQTSDGGYIAACWLGTGSPVYDIYLIRLDANGNTLWTKIYGGTGDDRVNFVSQTNDNGYILTGYSATYGYGAFLMKLNANGDSIWVKNLGVNTLGHCVQQTTDEGFIVIGKSSELGSNDVYLVRTDANSDILWKKHFGGNAWDEGFFVQQTTDGGYILVGFTYSFGAGSKDVYLIKTDSNGDTYTNFLEGNIFYDLSSDCMQDTGEIDLSNWMIKVEGFQTFHGTTDNNGFYSIKLDTGSYSINVIYPNSLWQSSPCGSSGYNLTLSNFYDTTFTNFPSIPLIYCPLLEVDITTWALRPCMNSTYTVSYCNTGTIDADNVYIEVEFDSVVSPVSSTLPWSLQSGNTYTFNIGTLTPNQCGSFQITAAVSCNAVLGSTHCTEARIFPDTMCIPADSTWDKSSVAVEGYCVGDSLACFTIYNTGDPGTGDMQGTSEYRIYENNILVSTDTFQLAGGYSTQICWTANGNTIRLEADQRPGHPGNSHPQDHVELCGGPPQILGQIILVPEDDIDNNVEIDCKVITGSYDPNDKSVKPVGLTSNHYIDSTDVLEYQINFQNTGTDTAFRVVIRDTLSGFLDVTTVQSGASSDPYTFRIYGQGILEWKFDNILLPDSNVNEPASHGFVKYKVNQTSNNANGTLIENRVGIIFDFNAPVITNTVWNIVYDTAFYDTTSSSVSDHINYDNTIKVNVFPNPFNTETTFTITGLADNKTLTFALYDIIGKKVKTIEAISGNEFQINRENLTQGLYIYKVFSNKEIIGLGKLVIE